MAVVPSEPASDSQPVDGAAAPLDGKSPEPRRGRPAGTFEGGHPLHTGRRYPFRTQMAVAYVVLAMTCARITSTMVISPDPDRAITLGITIVVVAPLASMAVMVLLGLPLRLVPKLRRWWIANGEISVAGIIMGCLAIAAAYVRGHQQEGTAEGRHYSAWIPDYPMLFAGWLVMAFFLTHVWFPPRWRRTSTRG
ncbi:hypothetical protein [Arthrobacter sp. OAP107]|uniref:hypothetical protein n=1 Tax=Arthrobacter sp. OAP107 TaxID=3156445 RepID=UPI0033917A7C